MNFVYALTCFSFIAALGFHVYASRQNQKRSKYMFSLIEDMIPKAFPHLFQSTPEKPMMSEEVNPLVEAGVIIPADSDLKFNEYLIRKETDDLTMEILKAHAYGMTYSIAHEKAEVIVTGKYAVNDAPLSEGLRNIVGNPTAGESRTAQASQPMQ